MDGDYRVIIHAIYIHLLITFSKLHDHIIVYSFIFSFVYFMNALNSLRKLTKMMAFMAPTSKLLSFLI